MTNSNIENKGALRKVDRVCDSNIETKISDSKARRNGKPGSHCRQNGFLSSADSDGEIL
jgi:hypothetical protein